MKSLTQKLQAAEQLADDSENGLRAKSESERKVRVCEEQREELRRRVYWTTMYMAVASHCYIILSRRFAPRLTARRSCR